MTAYLTHPGSGSVHVDPLTEILVTFETDCGAKDDIHIVVDGTPAVISGQIVEGFVETRYSQQDGIIQMGIRKRGKLPPRDILVSAWCQPSCSTVEQRFYVRGAQCKAIASPKSKERWCRTLGGVFSTPWGRPFPSRIAVNKEGFIVRDDRRWYVPPEIILETMDIVRYSSSWLLASANKNRTYVAQPTRIDVYNFGAEKVHITDDLINLKVNEDTSAHLPLDYHPAYTERGVDSWFRFRHEGSWNMEFTNHVHLWWCEDKMIAKHFPKPLRGKSDDMLWTKKDLKSEINKVRVVDSSHVVVNDDLYVNTYHPEITHI